ncbi:sigma-70 family RNA polymerase sigma factor [Pontiellaceae bacterium B1224]|nr:sigma-70 family RNA polymerase sigma factor [Pontiellaceae bacterium B1224]
METGSSFQPDSNSAADGREDIFVTTRWTLIQRAGDSSSEARRALEEVCRMYWFPLYAYVRRRSYSPEDAEDLTQAFFAHLLEHGWLKNADRDKGRLRAFLITALKRFMAKEWRKASARKRGGGIANLSINAGLAEGRYEAGGSPSLDAEAMFDRQWALAVLDATLQRLEAEFAKAGKATEFLVLKETLVLTRGAIDYAEIAARLKMSEGAARVATHRLRKRFRQIYRDEVAETLPVGANLDEEARYLAESLAKG